MSETSKNSIPIPSLSAPKYIADIKEILVLKLDENLNSQGR